MIESILKQIDLTAKLGQNGSPLQAMNALRIIRETIAKHAAVHPTRSEGERKLSDLGNELHNLSCSIVHENEEWAEQISGIARELWNWPQARAALAQPSPTLPPFAEKVLAKLRRFNECAEDSDSGGVDIGRHWLDLLTQLGLLNRVQRSPALWEISQQGEDLLGLDVPEIEVPDSMIEKAWQRFERTLQQLETPGQAEQAEQAEADRPEVFGLERYRVEKTEHGFWPYCVLAGDGTRELFVGHLKQCQRVAAQLATAFEDGKFIAQHESIVGGLRAEITQLRQHKNDYMDAGQETYRALQNEIREREAEIARLDGLVSGRTAERDAALAEVERIKTISDNYYVLCVERQQQLDAALARVAELTATRNRYGVDAHYFNKNLQRILRDFESFTPDELARSLIILAKVADEKVVAQAQHSVPELLEWAVGRWHAEVSLRPLINVHRRALDDTWRQVIRRLGGDTGLLCGPSHDELLAAAPGTEVPQAWLDVQSERRRQVESEGWTPEHDDLYCAAELPRAAAAYILNGANDEAPAIWPFSAKWWKPRDARSNYVRASALILAEIERLDRAAEKEQE